MSSLSFNFTGLISSLHDLNNKESQIIYSFKKKSIKISYLQLIHILYNGYPVDKFIQK